VVTIKLGRAWKDPANFIHLRSALATRTFVIHSGEVHTIRIPAPAPPFRVETTISPTFVPAKLDRHLSDGRHLGAQVGYSFG
jgi:hypothetical protein